VISEKLSFSQDVADENGKKVSHMVLHGKMSAILSAPESGVVKYTIIRPERLIAQAILTISAQE
jgi:hypothetical protein